MSAATPAQAAEAAIRAACAKVLTDWTAQIDAAGDDVVQLRRIFRCVTVEVGQRLGDLLVTAGAGSCTAAAFADAIERTAGILSEVVVDLGQIIGRNAGAPFASAAWLSDVATEAATALRDRTAELRQAAGGKA